MANHIFKVCGGMSFKDVPGEPDWSYNASSHEIDFVHKDGEFYFNAKGNYIGDEVVISIDGENSKFIGRYINDKIKSNKMYCLLNKVGYTDINRVKNISAKDLLDTFNIDVVYYTFKDDYNNYALIIMNSDSKGEQWWADDKYLNENIVKNMIYSIKDATKAGLEKLDKSKFICDENCPECEFGFKTTEEDRWRGYKCDIKFDPFYEKCSGKSCLNCIYNEDNSVITGSTCKKFREITDKNFIKPVNGYEREMYIFLNKYHDKLVNCTRAECDILMNKARLKDYYEGAIIHDNGLVDFKCLKYTNCRRCIHSALNTVGRLIHRNLTCVKLEEMQDLVNDTIRKKMKNEF